MKKELEQFLKGEKDLFEERYRDVSSSIKTYGEYCNVRDFNKESNIRVINKIINKLEEEINKKEIPPYPVEHESLNMLHEGAVIGYSDAKKDLLTIINSLKVK